MSQILSQVQKAQIFCIKNGHANYITTCFGYVHCGRCSDQIGDTLGGIFDTSNKILVKHNCKKCNNLKKELSPLDKKILSRLEAEKSNFPNYDEILKEIDFN